MEKYNPEKIEKKWQKNWEKLDISKAFDKSKKPKLYLLVEFPYPSGTGLHVGHCRSYVAMDIIARKKRMQGFNVLFPMGWDAFGLPTENFAIKTGIHPEIATKKNTANFKLQQKSLGFSFDWGREINTTDPDYYKWTQWIFIQLFKKGLAYKAKMPINWCPACKIGLANEEVVAGACERCGKEVVKREKEQWMLKITKYAERLIEDLEKVDYPERVMTAQKEWIGRSEGTEVEFKIQSSSRPKTFSRSRLDDLKTGPKFEIDVFTTRIDTIFGATYLVIAPEYPLIEKLKSQILNYKYVQEYIEETKKKSEKQRLGGTEGKSGVELIGIKAVNPVNKKRIPIFVADYVLMNYGTSAVMAVPAHDQRDFDFAKKYNLPIIEVIEPREQDLEKRFLDNVQKAYEGEGVLINSGRFSGMDSVSARKRITEQLEKKGFGKKRVNYKLRDWIFSRQRYWGEPIPMINCQKCGWIPVPEKDLPIKLPGIKEYKPTEKGESPLAKARTWVQTKCPKCRGKAERETDVMPNWAGSNWYYLRFCDPENKKRLADPKLLKYWMPVDWYNGGMEHTTLHLLYSRFIFKFLWDIGAVPKSIDSEPYKKRTSHGVILGEGGIKMSKSKGNVINPSDVIKEYGADTLRTYEMFMGPFEQMIPWDTKGVNGVRRFLEKVWKLSCEDLNFKKKKSSLELKKTLHKTIKKVSEDIDSLKFNTAVSSLMEFSNKWSQNKEGLCKNDFADFLKILSVFIPHLAEELWEMTGFKGSIFKQQWPKYNPKFIKETKINLIIQINGRVRDKMEIEQGTSEEKLKEIVLSRQKVIKWTEGRKIKKVIFVPDKLINIVI